jgi:hypothetical protein
LDPDVRQSLIVACVREPQVEIACAALQAEPPASKVQRQFWEFFMAAWLHAEGFEYVGVDYTRKVLVIRMAANVRVAMYLRSMIK